MVNDENRELVKRLVELTLKKARNELNLDEATELYYVRKELDFKYWNSDDKTKGKTDNSL